MGGHIWVTSEEGKGSQFRFNAHFGRHSGAEPERPSLSTLNDLKVLVVDDNAANRTILEELLGSWRMHVTVADSASAALTAMRNAVGVERPFDLVLTDAMMPDVDGFSLAREIASDEMLSHAKVIMLTSASAPPKRPRGLDRAIASQLTKPVKQSDLMDAILDAFALVGRRAATERPVVLPRSVNRRLRVLLADDNPTNRKLVELLLGQQRHRVTAVSNGREAVDKAAKQVFDLVLMDVQMPEMDGFQATAAIRERERKTGVHVPIIAMTAHAMPGDRERCLDAGMDAYLPKPLRIDDLVVTIARFFGPDATPPVTPTPRAPASDDRPNAPSVDEAALLADFGQNRKVLREVISVFLTDAPSYVNRIRSAAASNDAVAIAAASHALKGSAGLFSKGAAYEAARELELAAKAGGLSAPDTRFRDIEAATAQLCAELEAIREKLAPE
jgi:CheY-like chemotaxis protein